VTHLQRINRAKFFRSWSCAIGEQATSWNSPDRFAKWNLVESLTFFKFFCRRTNFDHYYNSPPTKCKCGTADISALHLLRDCPSFEQARGISFRAWGALPDLELSMVLDDSEIGTQVREFISKAGFACGCTKGWDGIVPT
jgi:hypothetical protein